MESAPPPAGATGARLGGDDGTAFERTPRLSFAIEDAQPVRYAVSPAIALTLRVTAADGPVEAATLQCQVQIDVARRVHRVGEQTALLDLFGHSSDWARTVHPLHWARVGLSVGRVAKTTTAELLLPCTYDVTLAVTKYVSGLEGGSIPLLLLFSGAVFYTADGHDLQVVQLPWSCETRADLGVEQWRAAIGQLHGEGAWIHVPSPLVDRLRRHQAARGLTGWPEVIEDLLDRQSMVESAP